jgi:hypothetical protein
VKTNVPDIRLEFRYRTLLEGLDMIRGRTCASGAGVGVGVGKLSAKEREGVLPTADAIGARAMAR